MFNFFLQRVKKKTTLELIRQTDKTSQNSISFEIDVTTEE